MSTKFSLGCASLLCSLMLGCGGGGGNGGNSAPSGGAVSINTQPLSLSVVIGRSATFSVVATGAAPLSYQWQKNGTPITGATASSYTTAPTTASDSGSTFLVAVSNAGGSKSSNEATLTVATGTTNPAGTDVTTYKNDLNRSGQNLSETTLTLSSVASSSFGLLRKIALDGKVDAQPLYVSRLSAFGAFFNTLFVATEHDSVYALDSDSGAPLWQVSLLSSGESPSTGQGCNQITPEIGVTATPVIDRSFGAHGAIYVIAMSVDASGNYHQRLHALDLATGAELQNPTDISATYPAGAGTTSFNPGQYAERAALLLSKGTIYTSWTSHCDGQPYSGWVIAFAQNSLARTAILNVAANSNRGPAIWMSGGGPAADSAGNIYLLTANGAFETSLDANGFPSGGDYGNSFVKIANLNGTLTVEDYFALSNTVAASSMDQDLGSGGEMLLPDLTDSTNTVRHLIIGAGKDGNIYVVDRDSMGKFNASTNKIWQQLNGAVAGGIWSTPAYFNGSVYYADVGGALKAFAVTQAKLGSAVQSQSATQFVYPGTAPSVSANGIANGIVWAHENTSPAVLHAYEAANLAHELYNSNQAAGNRDQFGAGNKYITPTVADGKVFIGTANSVAVFGLLN
jgi:hypothetical protein